MKADRRCAAMKATEAARCNIDYFTSHHVDSYYERLCSVTLLQASFDKSMGVFLVTTTIAFVSFERDLSVNADS